MLTVSSKVLSLSAEAAVLVRGGRVVFANPAACALLGADCVGVSVAALFGREIAETQAASFTTETTLGQKRCILRTGRVDELQAFFFSECELEADLLSDAFFCSLRSTLMNFRLACETGRSRAEQYGDGELDASFRSIQRESHRIARLLDNASVVRAMAEGTLSATVTALDLAALCRAIIDSVSLLRKDVRFALYADEELWLLGDRALLEQLVLNLLSNALVHAAPLGAVTLRLTPTPTQVILSVSDDGCGIAEEKMNTVFERFRAPYTLSELSGGAGLGLSVVRAIARLHEGTLLLESRPGSGTAARVSLARKLPAKTLRAASEQPSGELPTLLTGLADALPVECFGGQYLD